MKVLVTGHRGYIGVHLVDILVARGESVTGCDLGLYDGCEWEQPTRPSVELRKDVRELTVQDLRGFDCVMHLAAISNDPMGELDRGLTEAVNLDGSVRLARLAKDAGVPRFLFAGSCSVYGAGANLDLDESAPLNPLTSYAKSKIEAEASILALASDSFCAASLRNSTAYGYSPMLRIDLVVNNLLAFAHATGEIRVMSDGSPWRPLIHCRDIARAFVAFMDAPADVVCGKAVNVGADQENYQVKDVVDCVKRACPDAKVTYTGEVGNDPRNYRVSFKLLHQLLPEFRLEYTVAKGVDELHAKMRALSFTAADLQSDQFVRLRALRSSLQKLDMSSAAVRQ